MADQKKVTVKMMVSRAGQVPASRGDEIEVGRLEAARMLRAGQIAPLDEKLTAALAAELAEFEKPAAVEVATEVPAGAETAAQAAPADAAKAAPADDAKGAAEKAQKEAK